MIRAHHFSGCGDDVDGSPVAVVFASVSLHACLISPPVCPSVCVFSERSSSCIQFAALASCHDVTWSNALCLLR